MNANDLRNQAGRKRLFLEVFPFDFLFISLKGS